MALGRPKVTKRLSRDVRASLTVPWEIRIRGRRRARHFRPLRITRRPMRTPGAAPAPSLTEEKGVPAAPSRPSRERR